jgi:hypothetical protein
MDLSDIAKLRMQNQRITATASTRPEQVVAYMGAVQAQDYRGALWAVGLRMRNGTQATVEHALATGAIVRTWPMRGTLHFVAAADARWMLDLLAPRVTRAVILRSEKQFGIRETTIVQCKKLITAALRGGKRLSRPALYAVLNKGGIDTANSRGLHILGRLALDKVICFGPREGTQQVFVLFNEWIPKSKALSRDEALATLALRYFTSHGPAQIQDCAWWAGLPMKDVRHGVELAGRKLTSVDVDGKTYWMKAGPVRITDDTSARLLAPFDEFLVAYRDRDASLEAVHARHINPGANGMLNPIVVVNGQVLGTWKRAPGKGPIHITTHPFTTFSRAQTKSIAQAESVYRAFVAQE